MHSEVSVYFRDPDGARLELIADPLGEMYGDTRSCEPPSDRSRLRGTRLVTHLSEFTVLITPTRHASRSTEFNRCVMTI